MMKWFLLLWFAFLVPALAEEAEVRLYRLSEAELQMVHRQREPEIGDRDWLGAEVEEPGFESRFFEGGGSWYDCTKRVAEILEDEEFSGAALMDRKRGLLVMKAEGWDQEDFTEMVLRELPTQIRTAAAIYELPGVVSGMRPAGFIGIPEGGRLRAKIAGIALVGMTLKVESPGGEISLEVESQMDADGDLVEQRFLASGTIDGNDYAFRTGITAPFGMPWAHELGSMNGEKSLVLVMTPELVKMDGTLVDEIFVREEGGVFLRERRLNGMRSFKFRDDRGEFREYPASPGIIDFWTQPAWRGGDDSDPFAADDQAEGKMRRRRLPLYGGRHPELKGVGVVYDVKNVFRENGISFREGDFAVYNKWNDRIYAKLSLINHELAYGMMLFHRFEFGRMIRVDFEQIGGDGKVLKKVGVLVLPGQEGTVALGPDLGTKVEAQIDANDELIEARVTFVDSGGDLEKPSLQTGLIFLSGVPMVVQRTVGEEEKSWKVTATILEISEVVDDYLKRSE
jgi:hypothetical protein